MKTLFLKNGMPVATAVLAIAGAFATTSMQSSSQSSSSAFALVNGYVLEANGECNIVVSCSDVPSAFVCRLSYPDGDRAFRKRPTPPICITTLWRPM